MSKSPTIVVDFSVSICCVSFCFIYFIALLFGEYMVRVVMPSWLFYHYLTILFDSGDFLSLKSTSSDMNVVTTAVFWLIFVVQFSRSVVSDSGQPPGGQRGQSGKIRGRLLLPSLCSFSWFFTQYVKFKERDGKWDYERLPSSLLDRWWQ